MKYIVVLEVEDKKLGTTLATLRATAIVRSVEPKRRVPRIPRSMLHERKGEKK